MLEKDDSLLKEVRRREKAKEQKREQAKEQEKKRAKELENDPKTEAYSRYIGINRAVNPGIRVLIDFLSFYFEPNVTRANHFSWDEVENKIKDIVICKEESESVREGLYRAIYEWIRSYATFNPIDGKNTQVYLLPLTPGMILTDTNARDSVRNILNYMLYEGYKREEQERLYYEIQEKLFALLYSPDARRGGYEELLNILAIMFDESDTIQRKFDDVTEKPYVLEWKSDKLARDFRQDFFNLIENRYIYSEDIFKKINELNILLNFYIVRYMVCRSFEEEPNFIFAKGALNMQPDGKIHTAAVGNYANIRERTYKVSEKYYCNLLNTINKTDQKLVLDSGTDAQGTHLKLFMNKIDIWPDVRNNIFRIKKGYLRENEAENAFRIEDMLLNYLGGREKRIETSNREVAYACMEISKKRSSSVRRVSAVFSSQGKECYFAYPIGRVQQKYYVMSPQLTEVLVHLFLQEQEDECGTLEMLYQWLEEKYSIYIGYSKDLVRYLKNNAIEQPTQTDFDENQKAFITTLQEINCISKLSDNSYIITFDGEAGRW